MSQPIAAPEPVWLSERRRIGAGFAPLYAALAVVSAVVSSLDLYQTKVVQLGSSTYTRRYGSVWWLTVEDRGGVAAIGATLFLILFALLLVAALRPRTSAAIPIAIAVVGGVIGVMVAFRVGVREPLPDFAAGGQAAVAVAILCVGIGIVHALRTQFGPQPGRAPSPN